MQFKNVTLTFEDTEEHSNRNLNRAFETQHPELYEQLPHWTDNRGFHFVAGYECEVMYDGEQ